ncbi:MAG: hypothetical protein M1827_003499 [Pycnora praestabilis]|nr:MAG: hypothetical protein M1827_003499 [Pycnora praestabilis]
MPVSWNAEADAKLLLLIVKVHDVKLDYAALATGMGEDVTPLAVSKHIAKLRSKAVNANEGTPTSKPKGRPKGSTNKVKATPDIASPTTTKITNQTAPKAITAGKGGKKGAKRDSSGEIKSIFGPALISHSYSHSQTGSINDDTDLRDEGMKIEDEDDEDEDGKSEQELIEANGKHDGDKSRFTKKMKLADHDGDMDDEDDDDECEGNIAPLPSMQAVERTSVKPAPSQ